MLIDTIQYRPSTDEALTKLYGPVFFSSPSLIRAYSDGACFHNGTPHARAGAGIYFGPNSALNDSFRVTGPQTNNRGKLLAILKILVGGRRDRALHILTDSEYSIRSIVYWGPAHAAQGWYCSNGDLLSDIAAWIRYRTATLVLEHVHAHSGNAHNNAADALAKAGANKEIENWKTYVHTLPPPSGASPGFTPLNLPKVSTSLPPDSAQIMEERVRKRISYASDSHRGRNALRETQAHNLSRLTDASGNIGLFWREYRSLRKSNPWVPPLSAQDFADVFGPRMNPSPSPSPAFDHTQATLNQFELDDIPYPSPDPPADSPFELISVEDIGEAMDHIKDSLSPKSSRGGDGVFPKDLLEMDNDKLCTLFNECL